MAMTRKAQVHGHMSDTASTAMKRFHKPRYCDLQTLANLKLTRKSSLDYRDRKIYVHTHYVAQTFPGIFSISVSQAWSAELHINSTGQIYTSKPFN